MNHNKHEQDNHEIEAGERGLIALDEVKQELARQLFEHARQAGLELVGEDGLLTQVAGKVLETALEVELTDHLGYEHGGPRADDNARNGTYAKTVQTGVGPVTIQVPRDRSGAFEPQIVRKHQRRLDGFDEAVISLYAKGMTTGEIQKHLSEVYDAQVSRELISKVTDQIVEEMQAWRNRPLDPVWPVVFIDALYVKIRDGVVSNRPIYVALGVNLAGERDVLGLWVGDDGEGAKHWAAILAELTNRGIRDVWLLCCDGLKGLPDAVEHTWPTTTVQTCVVHLVRRSFYYSSTKHWGRLSTDMRRIYTAPTQDEAEIRRDEMFEKWGGEYPAVINLWRNAWPEFVPFLAFPPALRTIVYTTNIIESLNARFRRACRVRGHFPNETAALKVLYLTVHERDPKGGNAIGTVQAWKQALNELAVFYPDRMP